MLTGGVDVFVSAGTTRDSIRISWEYKGQRVDIVDTAGALKLLNIRASIAYQSC